MTYIQLGHVLRSLIVTFAKKEVLLSTASVCLLAGLLKNYFMEFYGIVERDVVANSNNSCLLMSVAEVHWRVQPSADRRSGRFNKIHGALRVLHVSQQCLYENYPQVIGKEQLPPNKYPDLNAMEMSCLRSVPRNYFETIRSPKRFLN